MRSVLALGTSLTVFAITSARPHAVGSHGADAGNHRVRRASPAFARKRAELLPGRHCES